MMFRILLLLSFPCLLFSQQEIYFNYGWKGLPASSFFDNGNYLVACNTLHQGGVRNDTIEVKGKADMFSEIDFNIKETDAHVYSYDIEADWENGRIFYISNQGVSGESTVLFKSYIYADNNWIVEDHMELIPEGYFMGNVTITDIDQQGRFGIVLSKKGTFNTDPTCIMLLLQSTDDGVEWLETIYDVCDGEYQELSMAYSDELDELYVGTMARRDREGQDKGFLTVYSKSNDGTYIIADSIVSPYEDVAFGVNIEYYNDRLYVFSAPHEDFCCNSFESWTSYIDIYEKQQSVWNHLTQAYSCKSELLEYPVIRPLKLMDIKKDMIAYTTCSDDKFRVEVANLGDAGLLLDEGVTIMEYVPSGSRLALPSLELSHDVRQVLVSSYETDDYLQDKAGIYSTNITSLIETAASVESPLESNVFSEVIRLKTGLEPLDLILYDVSGRILAHAKSVTGLTGLEPLPAGMYVLVVKDETLGSRGYRLIKN